MKGLLNIRAMDEDTSEVGIIHVVTTSLDEAMSLANSIMVEEQCDPDDIAIFEVHENWTCTAHGDAILCGALTHGARVN